MLLLGFVKPKICQTYCYQIHRQAKKKQKPFEDVSINIGLRQVNLIVCCKPSRQLIVICLPKNKL
jgi:hypothetical protein